MANETGFASSQEEFLTRYMYVYNGVSLGIGYDGETEVLHVVLFYTKVALTNPHSSTSPLPTLLTPCSRSLDDLADTCVPEPGTTQPPPTLAKTAMSAKLSNTSVLAILISLIASIILATMLIILVWVKLLGNMVLAGGNLAIILAVCRFVVPGTSSTGKDGGSNGYESYGPSHEFLDAAAMRFLKWVELPAATGPPALMKTVDIPDICRALPERLRVSLPETWFPSGWNSKIIKQSSRSLLAS
ncbi:hypothetical protein B0H66DRAFT_616875 [Apodospora peruviana]|uniref:Uncharacterized protein n=1 Tax=Apodospora peruviana TaxID=516989 RepID=A0AAE0IJG3_9PEZI|nr:hypothetical protein B0H66DRAFT_616875 [Apodospora peruviana]